MIIIHLKENINILNDRISNDQFNKTLKTCCLPLLKQTLSPIGMRESDDDPGPSTEGPDYLQDPHHHNGPRVKSAKGGKEMDSVVESIKELRQSLANNAMQQNHLSPTTGYLSFISYSRS